MGQPSVKLRIGMGRTLWNIASKMDLRTPKVVRKTLKRGRPHIRLTDAQVIEIIRRFRQGECASSLAELFGCGLHDISNWTTGMNRCRLLREVEAEERRSGSKSKRNRSDAAA